ncbi:MAG TPA: GNAT family N-acetyltransferase [Burkholderiales bacterium]|nr:GNAT family N-acetyltransferase [Burkholderiales bacterium]
MTSPLPIRPMVDADAAFVLDSWRRSYEGAAAVRACDPEHYRIEMTRAIRRIISNSTARTVVAYDPEDAGHIVGFACFSVRRRERVPPHTVTPEKPLPDTHEAELHYVYVKKDFRGQGIARALLEGVPVTSYTFLSPSARPRKGWRFTPRFTI